MTVYHVLMLRFKSLVPTEEVDAACEDIMALQSNCVHPTTAKPYVTVAGGGRDNSLEGLQNDLTHGFIFSFESTADRDYYVNSDPANQKVKAGIHDIVDKAQVLDFTSGVF